MRGLNNGEYLSDVEFELVERDTSGNIQTAKYKGAWLIVDNGYLSWPTTVPPFSKSDSVMEEKWSKWMESMRKDVECTFGILKGHWRILKSGIRMHSVGSVDRIWKTCCALHNWLLDVDGLSENWENGVLSVWEGPMGQHSIDAVRMHAAPSVLHDLQNDNELRTYNASRVFVESRCLRTIDCDMAELPDENENVSVTEDFDGPECDASIICNTYHLTLKQFCAKLVEHYGVMSAQTKVKWPVQNLHSSCNADR